MDMGIEPFLISSVLSCVIGQRLVRKVCQDCAETWTPPAKALTFWGLEPDENANFLKAKGCSRCNHTGYRGRIGIYEVLKVDAELQTLIANGASEAVLKESAMQDGRFTTMRQDAALKAQRGDTTLEEAAAEVVL